MTFKVGDHVTCDEDYVRCDRDEAFVVEEVCPGAEMAWLARDDGSHVWVPYEHMRALLVLEPITYDPSDGSAKGVRG